jgi:four helix bundle protein
MRKGKLKQNDIDRYLLILSNMEKKQYIKLHDLEVYRLARELSTLAWKIYERLTWQDKKTMGDQFISAIDSIGANIAESYGRYHYLDRIKFLYNSRESMLESINHWAELLLEREKASLIEIDAIKSKGDVLSIKLNNYIKSLYQSKYGKNDDQP